MPQWIAPVGAEAIFFPGQGLAEQMVYLQGEAGFGISTGSFVKSDFTTPEVSIKEGDRWYFRYTVEGDGNAHNVTRVVVLIESEGVEKYLDDTYEIDGTLTVESAQFVGGSSVGGSLASSISGAKHPAPMRISTGVTFSGLASVPGALAIPADSDPGWTTFGTAKTLSYSFSTPNSGINGGGIITAYIHRYDIQTSGGTHLGYLYKQAYYNASMVEVGHGSPNSGAKPIWLSWRPIPGNEQSGGGAFVGPVTQFSNRTFQIGHVEPGVIDTTHTGGLLASIDRMYTQVAGEFVLAGGLTGNPMGGANPVFGASVVFNAWAPAAQSFVGVLSGRAANNGGGTATLSLSYTIPEE